MENIEQIISDTLLSRPFCLEIDKRMKEYIYIYPMTLGRSYLSAGIIRNLDINKPLLALEPNAELIRLYTTNQDLCLRLLAINTLPGKMSLDNKLVEKRMSLFREIDLDQAVALLSYVLKDSSVDTITKHFGIDDELKNMHKAEKAKEGGGTLSFCGKSIWGTVIDTLAAKYHWTLDYILWEISYENIQLLIADSIKTVYLSEDEIKKAGIIDNKNVLDGNDPATWEKLKNFRWD